MATRDISLTGATTGHDALALNVGIVRPGKTVWLDMVVIGKSTNGGLAFKQTMAAFHIGTQVSSENGDSKRIDKGAANSWNVHPSVSNDGTMSVTVKGAKNAAVSWSVFVKWFEND